MRVIENGDIFTDDADVLVCPVNCVGVMGKGLALEFKRRFEWITASYSATCAAHELLPGGALYLRQDGVTGQRIWLVATKDDWRNPSRLVWIELACESIVIGAQVQAAIKSGAKSIAIPGLGCGLGELAWADVLPIMQRHFADIDVRIYAPLEGTR